MGVCNLKHLELAAKYVTQRIHHLQGHWFWKEIIEPLGNTPIHIIFRSRLSSKWRIHAMGELAAASDFWANVRKPTPPQRIISVITQGSEYRTSLQCFSFNSTMKWYSINLRSLAYKMPLKIDGFMIQFPCQVIFGRDVPLGKWKVTHTFFCT